MSVNSRSKGIILLACGAFSPPTPMHLRMFEIAKDHFRETNRERVIGGIISPVHDDYKKTGLALASHRCAMINIALKSSKWIKLSDWESKVQNGWSRTRVVLQYHQNYINSLLNDINGNADTLLPHWLPEKIRTGTYDQVQIKLLCGADLLKSFLVPGLWSPDDIKTILGDHGLVVITRSGSSPEQDIFESDLLTDYKQNITIIPNWIPNEISSTMIRRFLSRGLSVKYILDDSVIKYIHENDLYGTDKLKQKKNTSKFKRPGQAIQIHGDSPLQVTDSEDGNETEITRHTKSLNNKVCSDSLKNVNISNTAPSLLEATLSSYDKNSRTFKLSDSDLASMPRSENMKIILPVNSVRVIKDTEYIV